MQKCPKCGTEFEGKFCPECGEAWQEGKTCPNCGTKLAGSAKFCDECGYSFTKQPPATAIAKPSAFTAVKGWVAVHKKQTIIIAALLIVALLLAIILPIVIANRFNGTYYRFTNEQYNYNDMLVLTKDKWEQGALSGTFEVDGEKITMRYVDFLGITETQTGTIKDGVITLGSGNMEVIYAKKGALHEHSYGEWTVKTPSTCLVQGTEARVCVTCGKEETRTLPFGDHTATWIMKDKSHSKVCALCGANIVADEEHVDDGNGNCSICGCPLTPTEGLIYEQQDKGYFVKGIGTAGGPIIRISEIYQDLPVVGIAEKAFKDCDSLTTIIMPNSVTEIGRRAFQGCSSLISMTIPASVASIESGAFEDCSSLQRIEVAAENQNYSSQDGILYNKEKTEFVHIPQAVKGAVTIPEGVTEISNGEFSNRSLLTSIVIPEYVTLIGKDAFARCSSLECVTWNAENCTSAGSVDSPIFTGCTQLTTVTFGENVTTIPAYAFYGCSGLTSIVIPESVTSIEIGAFDGTAFYNDSSHWDESSVLYIGNYLIEAKNTISGSYTIRTNTKLIANEAFKDCSGLTGELKIPDSVTSIGSYAFYNCSLLEHINVSQGNKVYRSERDCLIEIETNTLIAGCKNSVIPESVTKIGWFAFYGCSSLTSIIVPQNVTSIGYGAFGGCDSLESISIPFVGTENNSSMDNRFKDIFGVLGVFENSSKYVPASLKEVVITGGTSIGAMAFDDCSSLTSITIPKSVTEIGEGAFYGCNSLEKVYYGGTKEDWNTIEIESNNFDLTEATRYYFSDGEPSGEQWTEWNYWWHFDDATGEAVEWKKN